MVRRSHRWAYAVLAGLVLLMCDVWNWDRIEPMLFGWMPIGFWWPALVTLACVPAFAYIFSVIWPDNPPDL